VLSKMAGIDVSERHEVVENGTPTIRV